MKRFANLIAVCVLFFSTCAAFCFTPDDIHSYTLENGLRIYVLHDSSCATVRFELDVYAGYSAQTEKTAGFFPLYARLLEASAFTGEKEAGSNQARTVDMSADCVRIVRTAAPLEVQQTLRELSYALRPLSVSDTTLRAALSEMKAEITEYAESTAGFINTAIDARMFPAAPWKQESGVYPALFTATTVASARTVLEDIGALYYTAENAALFVSGNITDSEVLSWTQKAFLSVRTHRADVPSEPPLKESAPLAESRRFVLTDDAFSSDMTQLVVQYDSFSRDEADLLSAVLNDDRSSFKAALSAQEPLGILGAEYINIASVQQKGSSRIIVQSLLQRTRTDACAQAELFLESAHSVPFVTEEALLKAAVQFSKTFFRQRDNAAALMEMTADWVASRTPQFDASDLFSKSDSLSHISAKALSEAFSVSPYTVFVLVNTSVYKKNAAAFKKAGYELITAKNGSWYTQQLYLAHLKEAESTVEEEASANPHDAAVRFIETNKAAISSFTLTNGIPVTVKRDANVQTATLLIAIEGGELQFAHTTPGLCAVITDSIALSVRKKLDAQTAAGLLQNDCEVHAETFAATSRIAITCSASDLAACISTVGEQLIFGDISPAMADGVCYDERTQWRLKTGTAHFQLLCEAMRQLYKFPYTKLYDDKADKPAQMEFIRITSHYPLFLDSSRYSLFVAGGAPETEMLQNALNEAFGVLQSRRGTESKQQRVASPRLPRKARKVKLRHLFLTDVSADKAGPKPAVLVPTTEFLDPILYCVPSPALSSTDSALFSALLYELSARIEKKLGSALPVRADCADDDMPFARLYVSNVAHTAAVDAAYTSASAELLEDIASLLAYNGTKSAPDAENAADSAEAAADADEEKDELLAALESRWLLNTLSETSDTAETARLMHTGVVRAKNAALYLEQYQAVTRATAEDYYIVAKAYFAHEAPLRLYSADAKK